jgi:hypothetical protein
MHNQPPYHSYLLRIWQTGGEMAARTAWRASLENPHTGEVLNFTSLEHLFEFLADQCNAEISLNDLSAPPGPSPGPFKLKNREAISQSSIKYVVLGKLRSNFPKTTKC